MIEKFHTKPRRVSFVCSDCASDERRNVEPYATLLSHAQIPCQEILAESVVKIGIK
jgi:hypothetical protein